MQLCVLHDPHLVTGVQIPISCLMNSIFVLRYYKQDVDKGDKVVCLQYKYTQIHQDLFPKMWKQVLVWGLNAVLIVAVGVAWMLVGDRQGTWLIEGNGG